MSKSSNKTKNVVIRNENMLLFITTHFACEFIILLRNIIHNEQYEKKKLENI